MLTETKGAGAPFPHCCAAHGASGGPRAGPERGGAKAIGGVLAVNGVLKSIDLSDNNLGDEGEKAIHDAVSGREGFELEM